MGASDTGQGASDTCQGASDTGQVADATETKTHSAIAWSIEFVLHTVRLGRIEGKSSQSYLTPTTRVSMSPSHVHAD